MRSAIVSYTDQDLLLTERSIAALERFIAEQSQRFSATEWEPEQRAQLDRLLNEFGQALETQRRKLEEIRAELRNPEK